MKEESNMRAYSKSQSCKKRKCESTSSSSSSEDEKPKKKAKKLPPKNFNKRDKRRRDSTSSSSEMTESSSSSSLSSTTPSGSSDECTVEQANNKDEKSTDKLTKKKKKRKKLQKLKEKINRKSKKKTKDKKKSKIKEAGTSTDIPIDFMHKSMAPMTKDQWEKQQSVVRKVYDEITGRHRLIKGDGEVIEEIVSRDRHKTINQQATRGDGNYFQAQINSNLYRK